MTFNNHRTFGIEVEFISPNSISDTARHINSVLFDHNLQITTTHYSDSNSRIWRLKPDGSVGGGGYGMELVSPILQGDEGVRELELFLNAINTIEGVRVNRSCGLHVHVGVSDWKIKQFRNLYKRYIKFESAIDNVLPNSRRNSNNQYCRSTSDQFVYSDGQLTEAYKNLQRCRTAQQIKRAIGGRYTKLNIESFRKHGTVEFRHHSGTTNVGKIMSWLRIALTMTKAADENRSIRVKTGDTKETYSKKISLMMKGLSKVQDTLVDDETRAYYNRRRRELCRSN